MHTATTAGKQLVPYQFKKGQSGNPAGRRKGARHKLSEAFIDDLYRMWQEHGPDVIKYSLMRNPVAVMQVVATLVPKDFNVQHDAGPSFRALWEAIAKGKLPQPAAIEDDA